VPGTPFSSKLPQLMKSRLEPMTRSLTVADAMMPPDRAAAMTRAPMCTAPSVLMFPSSLARMWLSPTQKGHSALFSSGHLARTSNRRQKGTR